jgi:AcrR family transcriptional regulator
MSAAMKKGEATRAKIVDEAGRMASVRGLAAVSLNDIADAVGLSKSGVFKHFNDKEDLHLAMLDAAVERFLALTWTPALKVAPGAERVAFIFERWLDWVETEGGPGGCPFMQASVEYDDQPGRVRDYLQSMHKRWQKTLAGEVRVITDPPLDEAVAVQAVFDIKSAVLGFGQQRRLLDDAQARALAGRTFDTTLERLSFEPTAA